MQVKKSGVKERIVNAAIEVFRERSFEKASIRDIASKAGVTKGNIYTYFQSKDDLFLYIVEPAFKIMISMTTEDYTTRFAGKNYYEVYTLERSLDDFKEHLEIIFDNRIELELLFFSSAGSKLSDFKEQIAKAYEDSSRAFYNMIAAESSEINGNVTDMFIHSCAMLYLSFVEEILIHDPSEEELKKYIYEMVVFVHNGIKEILKI